MSGWTWNGKGERINTVTSEKDIEQAVRDFEYNLKHNFERQEALLKEMREMKEDIYKDEELAKMKAERDAARKELNRGFGITEKEDAALKTWMEAHRAKRHGARPVGGVSGGGYSYEFYPTSIGTSGVCYCNACQGKAKREALAESKGDEKEYVKLIQKKLKEYDACFEFQKLG